MIIFTLRGVGEGSLLFSANLLLVNLVSLISPALLLLCPQPIRSSVILLFLHHLSSSTPCFHLHFIPSSAVCISVQTEGRFLFGSPVHMLLR